MVEWDRGLEARSTSKGRVECFCLGFGERCEYYSEWHDLRIFQGMISNLTYFCSSTRLCGSKFLFSSTISFRNSHSLSICDFDFTSQLLSIFTLICLTLHRSHSPLYSPTNNPQFLLILYPPVERIQNIQPDPEQPLLQRSDVLSLHELGQSGSFVLHVLLSLLRDLLQNRRIDPLALRHLRLRLLQDRLHLLLPLLAEALRLLQHLVHHTSPSSFQNLIAKVVNSPSSFSSL